MELRLLCSRLHFMHKVMNKMVRSLSFPLLRHLQSRMFVYVTYLKKTWLINIRSQHFGINLMQLHTDCFDGENEAIIKAETIFGFSRNIWQRQKLLATVQDKKILWIGNILFLAVITFANWKKRISQSGQELEWKTIIMYFLAEINFGRFLK
jgi:hypothetical protein